MSVVRVTAVVGVLEDPGDIQPVSDDSCERPCPPGSISTSHLTGQELCGCCGSTGESHLVQLVSSTPSTSLVSRESSPRCGLTSTCVF